MQNNRLDIVIFGATGYTGQCSIEKSIELLGELKWGIAGRNGDKMKNVMMNMGLKMSKDLSDIPIIVADVNDDDSLLKMAQQAKVVVNFCGPYRHFGESVVKACIASGTHHVDVSCEPQYMEKMQLLYDEAAHEAGVYVVSGCGFESLPADLGTVFHECNFNGIVNAMEIYLDLRDNGPGLHQGTWVNIGTWRSVIYMLAHASELRELRGKLFKERLPTMNPKLIKRPFLHHAPIVQNTMCIPYLGCDRSVVERSQRFLYETQKKRPVQVCTYMSVGSYFATFCFIIGMAIFALLTNFSIGRYLLLTYPKVISLGFASPDGPPEEERKKSKFSMWFEGQGWSNGKKDDQQSDYPSKKMITKVSGQDFGYGNTSAALLLCATTIINEYQQMPGKGGVLAPGAAFGKTNLIDKLIKNEIFNFEVVSQKDDFNK